MRVVATVLVFDNPHGAREVLRCLSRQTRPPDAVVVVDNASPAPVCVADDLLAALDGRLDLVRLDTNTGVGAGHNRAIRQALDQHGADCVWVLEHDCFPEPTCLADLLDGRSGRPGVLVPYCARNRYERAVAPVEGVVDTPVFTFNGTLFDRAVLDRVGAIEEAFFVGQEDFEFSARVRAAGFPIQHVNRATVLHAHRGSQRFDSFVSPGRLYYSNRNIEWANRPATVIDRVRSAAVAAMKSAAELARPGRGKRYARARWFAHRDARAGRLGRSDRRL